MRTTMSLAKACVLQGAAFVLWASLLLARSTASVVLRRQDGGFKGAGTRMQYLTKYLSEHRGAFESQLSEAQAQQPVIAQEATAADENADTEYTMTQAAKFYDITKQLQAQSVVAMQELLQVTDALLKVVGVNGNGQQCGNVKCGLHAVCTQTTQGAQCLCQPGYFGDGLKCSEPPTYLPKKLLTDGLNGLDERVLDLSMIPLGADRILVVYRNADRNNRGYLLLGTIRGTILEWGTPEMFSVNDKKEKVQAWDPSVVAAPGADGTNGKIVIAFRSAQADGDCLAVSADIDDSMGRGFMEWSPTVKFCEQQANSRIVGQLFPEENSYIAMFNRRSAAEGTFSGAALTFDLERFKMTPSTADPVQFSDTAVSDLRTARMSSTGFLLEFSRAPREDEENGGTVQQDAVVTYGMVEEGALTFLPAAISAFPKDMKKILYNKFFED
ncbi:unnamed protein product [Amoebophrya sp. A120]|nr:unnamed protein product [Amoebophrya sp. A120]|eukprot:GSA120T00017915001.1